MITPKIEIRHYNTKKMYIRQLLCEAVACSGVHCNDCTYTEEYCDDAEYSEVLAMFMAKLEEIGELPDE